MFAIIYIYQDGLIIAMRGIFIFFLLSLSCCKLYAQKLNGLVLDKETKKPVANASISIGLSKVYTSTDGKFALNYAQAGDKLDVNATGYENYSTYIIINHPDPLIIWLYKSAISLKEYNLNLIRNYRRDSIQLRKEFSSVFAYKAPSFKDVFVSRVKYVPEANFNGRYVNSTSSLMNFSLRPLIQLLNPKKDTKAQLQKRLNQNEQLTYIDAVFSAQRVKALTGLKGDSLQTFMDKYRPAIVEARNMTAYESIIYIRKSYDDFVKP